ncbi:glycoside hydrolase [Streptomyces sp. AJS327]|uniref:C40 family peptidase n=1 Tax=Streptomyces sp. AJS327 TaxID=2545265 RepID=UPI0015DF189C|nr:C40 family peptidase [Streptomyces sp. AJS327]MBA0054270.1 glycoside hydrolase [Streptomyces sp. AJS327]
MASHRKPRSRMLQSAASRRGTIGVTTAALASVTLLSQSANATPNSPSDKDEKPSIEEVKNRVDALYQQAGAATQSYNAAKEKSDAQRVKVDRMLDQVAKRTGKLNESRRVLGTYAAAQYRDGGISQTATLLLTKNPQGFFKQTHLMDRLTSQQKEAVSEYQSMRRTAAKKRSAAAKQLRGLSSSQQALKERKKEVQAKLGEARELLSKLTVEEKQRLAEIERKKRAEARQKARERAEAERKREAAEERERERERAREREEGGSGSGGGSGDSDSGGSDSSYAAKAEKVIAFAKKELGKPYVWGATGPSSYDCSGFTQAAWRTAGISLPRVTYDQVEVGTKVAKSDMKPGDLIFFYDDISHVGIYVGGGQMIHASKPGDDVKYESIDYMPFHSAVRPA